MDDLYKAVKDDIDALKKDKIKQSPLKKIVNIIKTTPKFIKAKAKKISSIKPKESSKKIYYDTSNDSSSRISSPSYKSNNYDSYISSDTSISSSDHSPLSTSHNKLIVSSDMLAPVKSFSYIKPNMLESSLIDVKIPSHLTDDLVEENYIDEETKTCSDKFNNYVLLINKQFDKVCYNFNDVYTIGNKIGEGGFGYVHEGLNKLTNKKVAIKLQKILYGESSRDTFKREIDNLKEVVADCGHFICIEGWGMLNKKIVIIMEYVQGISLFEFINNYLRRKDDIKMSEAVFFIIAHQLYDSLKKLHSKGFAHTDIKPENIMIHIDDKSHKITVKIIDFGLGCTLRYPCHFGGTPHYIPKGMSNTLQGRQLADMYALALTLLELSQCVKYTGIDYYRFRKYRVAYLTTLDIDENIKAFIKRILLYES